jgi:hypothetical protein
LAPRDTAMLYLAEVGDHAVWVLLHGASLRGTR